MFLLSWERIYDRARRDGAQGVLLPWTCCHYMCGGGGEGPIELRETKDLFELSLQNPWIGVDGALEMLAMNKTLRDLDAMFTIFKS